MVEFSPATREARVQFPANAFLIFPFLHFFFFHNQAQQISDLSFFCPTAKLMITIDFFLFSLVFFHVFTPIMYESSNNEQNSVHNSHVTRILSKL